MQDPRHRVLELLNEYSYKTGDFVLASGRRSSHYVDVRRTSLLAEGGALLGGLLLDLIAAQQWTPDAIGGMTLGADPLTTAAAIESYRRDGRGLASFLVRKAPKDHGTGSQVEASGDMPDAARVVILDDTVTTGGSTLQAIRAVEREGHEVLGCVCVVNREEGGRELLDEHGYRLVELFSLPQLAQAKGA